MINNYGKPHIRIYYNKNIKAAEYAGYGIEEEGIPYELLPDNNPESCALAYAAESLLGIALSIEGCRISVFTNKYKNKEAFIFCESHNPDMIRIMGQNAARIVKNIPLLPLENV